MGKTMLRSISFVFLVALLMSGAAYAVVTVQTTTPPVDHEGPSERVGSIRFVLSSDEFPLASSARPQFIRIQLTAGARIALTLATGDLATGGVATVGGRTCPPINLVVEDDGTAGGPAFGNIAANAVQLFRCVAGETDIWIRILDSTSDWALSPVSRVRFTIGVPRFVSEQAPRVGATVSQPGTILCFNFRNTPQFDPAAATTQFNAVGISAFERDLITPIRINFDPATPNIAFARPFAPGLVCTGPKAVPECDLCIPLDQQGRQICTFQRTATSPVVGSKVCSSTSFTVDETDFIFDNTIDVDGANNRVIGGKLVLTLSVGTFDTLPTITVERAAGTVLPIPTGTGAGQLPNQGVDFSTAVYRLDGFTGRSARARLRVSSFTFRINPCTTTPQDVRVTVNYVFDDTARFTGCPGDRDSQVGEGCPRIINVTCDLVVATIVPCPVVTFDICFPFGPAPRTDFFTGIALVNLSSRAGTAKITFWDASGDRFDGGTVTIPARGMLVRLVSELPRTPTGADTVFDDEPFWIRVDADFPIDGLLLTGDIRGNVLHGTIGRISCGTHEIQK